MPIPAHRRFSLQASRVRAACRMFESLEERRMFATVTVTTAADGIVPNDGGVSLREAITAINAGNDLGDPNIAAQSPGAFGASDTIQFNIAGGGLQTIKVGTDPSAAGVGLPVVSKTVTIDGTTQPGFDANIHAPVIELSGTSGGSSNGLTLNASNCVVRGLAINGFLKSGIEITGVLTTGNVIEGNYIGTDPSGKVGLGNAAAGVNVSFAFNNTIGGTTPAARNVISGNPTGVIFNGANGNHLQGNYIGTDATGTVAVPNASGVKLSQAGSNIIGGTLPGAGNVISGNTALGIHFAGGGAGVSGTVVQANLIGTDFTGAAALPNAGPGIVIAGDVGSDANYNLIGGTLPSAGNTIAYNKGPGVYLLGVFGQPDTFSIGNAIRLNSIHSNDGLGIDIDPVLLGTPPSFTNPNDTLDADAGPNNLQNFPVLASAVSASGSTTIQGGLHSLASQLFYIDFYSNDVGDPSGFGEGQTYVGTQVVSTDAGGNAVFNTTYPVSVSAGKYLTATATRADTAPYGDTSEFSQAIQVTAPALPPPTIKVSDVTQTEGSGGGQKDFNFKVTLSHRTNVPVTVHFKTQDGTATPPSDYTARNNTLTIPAGSLTGTVTVKVNKDSTAELNETFFLKLDSPTNAAIADNSGTATIQNDDPGLPAINPSIRIGDASITEGNSGTKVMTFTVTLSAATSKTVSVNFTTTDGTAKTGDNDYTGKSGTLTFIAGQTSKTITVTIKGDAKKESDESLSVLLSNPVNGSIVDAIGIGTIRNDD